MTGRSLFWILSFTKVAIIRVVPEDMSSPTYEQLVWPLVSVSAKPNRMCLTGFWKVAELAGCLPSIHDPGLDPHLKS